MDTNTTKRDKNQQGVLEVGGSGYLKQLTPVQDPSENEGRSCDFCKQLGCNCFDLAIGLDRILEVHDADPKVMAKQARKELVERALGQDPGHPVTLKYL